MINENKIVEAVKLIIEAIGENPEREGLIETPQRIANMYKEVFSGLNDSAEEHLSKTFAVDNNDIVIEKDIQFYSMCEHHFLPFYGKIHIAYIPAGRVAGLSKLARTVEVYARRPQLQERLTSQVADSIMKYLNAQGALVIAEAEHLCMTMRGVQKPGTKTVTISARGEFENNLDLRSQIISLINNK